MSIITINQIAQIEYQVYGHGEKNIIAFHGYGQDCSVFKKISESLDDGYTFYSINLFYHGQSQWHDSQKTLDKGSWKLIFQELLQTLKIDRFSIMGYSIGGRLLLATLESFCTQIDTLYFLAAEGIRINPFYTLVTHNFIGNQLYQFFTSNNHSLEYMMTLTSPFMPKKARHFIENHMDTPEKKQKLYNTWMIYKDFYFSEDKISEIINHNSIKTYFFVGKYDQIVRSDQIKPLYKKIKNAEWSEFPCGHAQLISKVAQYFKTQIKND